MELEERRPPTENMFSQAKEDHSELIEEERQTATYLTGWKLHVLTGG